MPTYDYVCDECGYEFEEFHSMSAPPITDCPKCKTKNKVRRLIGTGAGIIFKGSGFYETDYKRRSTPESFHESKHKSVTKETTETKEKPAEKKNNKEAA